MKIDDKERETRQGEYPAAWVLKSADFRKLQDYLFSTGQGYKFAIIFDCTKDEYEELEEVPVYYLDTVFEELIDYCGVERAERLLAEYKEKYHQGGTDEN